VTLRDLIASGVTHALSLHPEWAFAVAQLDKRIENRSRMMPRTHAGRRFAIHAGACVGGRTIKAARLRGCVAMLEAAVSAGWSVSDGRMTLSKGDRLVTLDSAASIATSAIVATAIVRAVLDRTPTPTEPWHVAGEYGYVLEEVEVLPVPIPAAPGALGFWSLARCREAA